MKRDYSRVAAINPRVHKEVLYTISHILQKNEGVVRGKGIVIDIGFMSLLYALNYVGDVVSSTLGATYRQIFKIGHQVGFNKKQMVLWVRFCRYLPLSQRMTSYLISNLNDKEKQTEETKRLIDDALGSYSNIFEPLDNEENPESVSFKGDQITPGMATVLDLLIQLGGKENFVDKKRIVAGMKSPHGSSINSTNGLLYQLKKRNYVEVELAHHLGEGDDSRSTSYRLGEEFRRFLENHDLYSLVREHLRK